MYIVTILSYILYFCLTILLYYILSAVANDFISNTRTPTALGASPALLLNLGQLAPKREMTSDKRWQISLQEFSFPEIVHWPMLYTFRSLSQRMNETHFSRPVIEIELNV